MDEMEYQDETSSSDEASSSSSSDLYDSESDSESSHDSDSTLSDEHDSESDSEGSEESHSTASDESSSVDQAEENDEAIPRRQEEMIADDLDMPKSDIDRYAVCVLRLTSVENDDPESEQNAGDDSLDQRQLKQRDRQTGSEEQSSEESQRAALFDTSLEKNQLVASEQNLRHALFEKSLEENQRVATDENQRVASFERYMEDNQRVPSFEKHMEEHQRVATEQNRRVGLSQARLPNEAPPCFMMVPGAYAMLGVAESEQQGVENEERSHREIALHRDMASENMESGNHWIDRDGTMNGTILTVANAIDADEIHQAFAVDYEEVFQAKERNRQRYSGTSMACFLLFYVVLPICAILVCVLLLLEKATLASATKSSRETLGIRELVVSVVGAESLSSTKTPYSKALEWIIHTDPAQAVPSDPAFMQRYIAAYFYFATSEKNPWSFCHPPTPFQDESCEYPFRDPYVVISDDTYFLPAVRWLSSYSVCIWAGIKCDELGQIKEIEIDGVDMTGSFPEGVKYLAFLQSLSMSDGKLAGPLPADLPSMKYLHKILLDRHPFTGTIPLEWWRDWRHLTCFGLINNSIKGTLPSEIGNLVDAKWIHLRDNQLEGSIPEEIGRLSSLNSLSLGTNRFTGTIPATISDTDLYALRIAQNQLEGPIPSAIGLLTRLMHLELNFNQFSGELPDELWDLPLQYVLLDHCNFSGTISPKIAEEPTLDLLGVLHLHDNHFTGTLPTEMGRLERLQELWISANDFSGSMPEEICLRRGEKNLVQLRADCLKDPVTGVAEMACDDACCTTCCDALGEYCLDYDDR